ncbi:MAG TPA: hypothetical protein VH539_18350 [Gemmatimonadaceae bacterium]
MALGSSSLGIIAYGPYAKRPDQPANVIIRDGNGNLIQIAGSQADH